MKPDVPNKTFGIANRYILIGIVVLLVIGIPAFGVVSMITADTSNIGGVLTVTYSGTDTTTVQSYFNTAGISEIVLNGDMTIGTITVPSNIRKISGNAIIRQATVPGNGFEVHDTSNLTIEGISFIGQTFNASVSGNTAIDILNSTRIDVINNYFTGWRHLGVRVRNSTSVDIYNNEFYNNTNGISLESVQRVLIQDNHLNKSQYSNFTVGIAVQNYDAFFGTKSNNTDIEISDNTIENFPNSQAILVHDCVRCHIHDNTLNLIGWGVYIGGFNTNDLIHSIEYNSNIYKGIESISPTAGFDSAANLCIDVDGSTTKNNASNISIKGNTCIDANRYKKIFNHGAIIIGALNYSSITDNNIIDAYGDGIVMSGYQYNISIARNDVIHTIGIPGNAGIGIYQFSGSMSGIISHNNIQQTITGIEYDTANPGLEISFNIMEGVTNAITAVGSIHKATHNVGADI